MSPTRREPRIRILLSRKESTMVSTFTEHLGLSRQHDRRWRLGAYVNEAVLAYEDAVEMLLEEVREAKAKAEAEAALIGKSQGSKEGSKPAGDDDDEEDDEEEEEEEEELEFEDVMKEFEGCEWGDGKIIDYEDGYLVTDNLIGSHSDVSDLVFTAAEIEKARAYCEENGWARVPGFAQAWEKLEARVRGTRKQGGVVIPKGKETSGEGGIRTPGTP